MKPKNKIQYKNLINKNNPVDDDDNLLLNIYHFLVDIGCKEMPQLKDKRKDYLKRFHETICLKNNQFPREIDFEIVYAKFFSDVLLNKINDKRYGTSTAEIARMFQVWMTKAGVMSHLYDRYYNKYPEKKPKKTNKSERTIADFTDQEILNQVNEIKKMWGEVSNYPMFCSDGAKSYFNRLYLEYEKRGLNN